MRHEAEGPVDDTRGSSHIPSPKPISDIIHYSDIGIGTKFSHRVPLNWNYNNHLSRSTVTTINVTRRKKVYKIIYFLIHSFIFAYFLIL